MNDKQVSAHTLLHRTLSRGLSPPEIHQPNIAEVTSSCTWMLGALTSLQS